MLSLLLFPLKLITRLVWVILKSRDALIAAPLIMWCAGVFLKPVGVYRDNNLGPAVTHVHDGIGVLLLIILLVSSRRRRVVRIRMDHKTSANS